jgi:hypothetical protein
MTPQAAKMLLTALGLLTSLWLPAKPPSGSTASKYEWQLAVPPKQGNWPRWMRPVVGWQGKLWAVEQNGAARVASSEDGIAWVWTASDARWGDRYLGAVAFFQRKLWLLGGRVGPVPGHDYRNDVWYTEDGRHWTLATQSASWSPRAGHSALVYRDKLWLMGGGGRRAADDVWSSSDGVHWTRVTEDAGWAPIFRRSFVVFDDRIWVVGYQDGSDVRYTTDGARWIEATPNAGWPANAHKDAVVYDGRVWVMGGASDDGRFLNDVWCSPDGVRWEQVTPQAPWLPRAANFSVEFRGRLWIYGGKNGPDDVWHMRRSAETVARREN